jgi:hypothetical protein
MWRSPARTSYFCQPGYSSTPFAQISSRSRGVASRAVARQASHPMDTAASGWALRFVVPGRVFYAAPVGRDEAQAVGVRDSYDATVRGSPDLAPVVVSMTAGMPVVIPAKLLLPPVTLVMSRSR